MTIHINVFVVLKTKISAYRAISKRCKLVFSVQRINDKTLQYIPAIIITVYNICTIYTLSK